ncbi:hypothetical protein AYI70_g2261 [Smittium culicis]|uniref:Uncharacterized protein n=1 Tax=Smittium culicis TaxID=133412 RepID=A0A1R1Y989_9FUNG|nr:hypothetical protein AYI70_g2261 [Smittium culicis]
MLEYNWLNFLIILITSPAFFVLIGVKFDLKIAIYTVFVMIQTSWLLEFYKKMDMKTKEITESAEAENV